MTQTVQFRTDPSVKQQSSDLFQLLGITMSDAINMFLRQAIMCGGLPFDVKVPQYNAATCAAIEDIRQSRGERGKPVLDVLAELEDDEGDD